MYIRWGHDTCPTHTGAWLVYSGRVGGSFYNHRGGGADPQCLTPRYLQHNYRGAAGPQQYAFMFGAEYQGTNPLRSSSADKDVPCAVCYVPSRSALLMQPGRTSCPSGWVKEYSGYLMSEHYNHHQSTFSCVDSYLKSLPYSSNNHNGFLFYPVEVVCGSLPCSQWYYLTEIRNCLVVCAPARLLAFRNKLFNCYFLCTYLG